MQSQFSSIEVPRAPLGKTLAELIHEAAKSGELHNAFADASQLILEDNDKDGKKIVNILVIAGLAIREIAEPVVITPKLYRL